MKGRSVSAAADPQRVRTTSSFRMITTGRFAGKRTFSDCNPPPLHIILSSNPGLAYRRKSTAGLISQNIAVRPISKKDVFYAGSTSSVGRRSSISARGLLQNQDDADSEANAPNDSAADVPDHEDQNYQRNASVVSIPAKDVIEKVNREKEKIKNQKKAASLGAKSHNKEPSLFKFLRGSPFCPFLEPKFKKKSTPNDPVDNKRFCTKTSSVMKEMLDFSLVTQHPSFALLSLSNVFGMMGFYIPFVYIIQHLRTQVKGSYVQYSC